LALVLNHTELMNEVTLVFPLRLERPQAVLLGIKKDGFGAGKYVGFGGKIEPGEMIAEAAERELWEEAGLRVPLDELRAAGRLTFLFPARPDWDHLVHVFTTTSWQGQPRESSEITPVWFPIDRIPYHRMWDDASYWLRQILDGEKIEARFVYDDDNEKVKEVEVLPWTYSAKI
jgi:8-oxo-dGTP pyrophosphatase MutT (NUDIX family)